jgi:intracellular multiplication protein IcmB
MTSFNPFRFLKEFFGSLSVWFSTILKQANINYCELETADSPTVLATKDGSLVSVLKISGIKFLVGKAELDRIHDTLQQSLQTVMSQAGHVIQVYFSYNKDDAVNTIKDIFSPARFTADRLSLKLQDLFAERINYLSKFCASEEIFLVLWTRLKSLTSEQIRRANQEKMKQIKKAKISSFLHMQNFISAVPDLRENHDSFVRLVLNDMNQLGIVTELLEVHQALHCIRLSVDAPFTDEKWLPVLPGDKITLKEYKNKKGDISDLLWPTLAKQLMPREGENINLKVARVGDRIYSTIFIDLFPKEVQPFARLFTRLLSSHMPWRISFLTESHGLEASRFKTALSAILSFSSQQNRLLHDSLKLLQYINLNTDDSIVKLRVAASTWAPCDDMRLLRARTSMLAKAIEGWGSCDVSEICGDAYSGVVSTMLAISGDNVATASIAPLSDVLKMLPLFRPASPWKHGAILFRSPDGKPWPYQPGSRHQTTWIDLFYARPGSGKSVLSNAINLALCLASGLRRLPRIAIVDIGPSSSGLISLLKEALPVEKKRLVAYHRLRMNTRYAINPFDTQLGARYPMPTERSFLVNFLTLLATPVGSDKPYDGITDMVGLVIDELYKHFSDENNPNNYAKGVDLVVDGILEDIGFVSDQKTTWWEITDALFVAGFENEARLAQRYAMPVLADVASICRLPAIQDLYGKLTTPTNEDLIHAFSRMISSAVREYPIISQVTQFDLGDTRIVSLDLHEVARSGGDAANRQTAVMYMLARYVLARHYYLTEDDISHFPEIYRSYHQVRITEIREDAKRIVMDEFHRTAKASAVREQVIQDMREGRKWNVQVALISQSLDDFDEVMVEFATSIFIMDAGPEQTVNKTAKIFGLSDTAKVALRTRVHGPKEGGATFLAQFATKEGVNTQLLTATLGPIELWALNTTAEDVNIRNQLSRKLGPQQARRVLAARFPSGTATQLLEERYAEQKEQGHIIDNSVRASVINDIVSELLNYKL